MIPYGRQSVDDDDIAAVVRVLKGDWLTRGPAVEEFERVLAERLEVRHAVAFANGTAALHGATAAAGLGPGDRVATSPLSFAASAACAVYVGAEPTYVDVDPTTMNLDPAAVPDDVDALVAVHYAGLPVDLRALNRRPAIVIEDAAQALGAWTPDGPVGNCAHSDLTCFSFHPVKSITTGEGGAVTTNDDALAERLRAFRHHGLQPEPEVGPWATRIDTPGYNYRLTDLQAALGTTQLAKLDRFIARRQELAARYDALLADLDVVTPPAAPMGFGHARHLYPVLVEHRAEVFADLRAAGIGVQVHHVPIHHHPAYAAGTTAADLPHTEALYAHLLSLPLFYDLTVDEQDMVVDRLREALG
jgi:UDP-4-amino-4,6-dideoxy-N-acetyl-beta-L-altrosamine transaminase